MIERLSLGFRYITVDETWFDTFGFHRMAWAHPGEACRQTSTSVTPRLAFILALDSNGQFYFALH